MKKCPACNLAATENEVRCRNCDAPLIEVKELTDTGEKRRRKRAIGPEDKLKKKLLVWRICSVIFIISMIGMVYTIIKMNGNITYWSELASQRSVEIENLSEEKTKLQGELKKFQDGNQEQITKIAELQEQINKLEEEENKRITEITNLEKERKELEEKEASLRSDYEELQKAAEEAEAQVDFMDTYAAIIRIDDRVEEEDKNLYHKYSCCKQWEKPEIIIYNISAAKANGYSACPICY